MENRNIRINMEKKILKEIWYNNERIECTIIKAKIKIIKNNFI